MDAGQQLLAAIEALAAKVDTQSEEIRALRKEAREDRETRDWAEAKKLAGAERQARYRGRLKSQISDVTLCHSDVTPKVVSSSSVVLEQEHKATTKTPALRHSDAPLRNTAAVWESYSAAFEKRHHAKPVRNATTNAQMAQFVKRIAIDEAAAVAEFYVFHNLSWYVQKLHPVGMLLKDAESLRAQWASGKRMTVTEAQQQDRTEANVSGWAKHLSTAKGGS